MRNLSELVAKLLVTLALLVGAFVPSGPDAERDWLVAAIAGYWLREGERQTLRAAHEAHQEP